MRLSFDRSMELRTILRNLISIPLVLSLRGSVRPISLMGFYPRGLTAPFAH